MESVQRGGSASRRNRESSRSWPGCSVAVGRICPTRAVRAESGLERGRRSLDIAEKLDNEASRVAAYVALGVAYLVEGQPAAARDAAPRSARDRSGSPRRAKQSFPWSLAVTGGGAPGTRRTDRGRRHGARGHRARERRRLHYFEVQAQLALAAALLATDGVVPRAEIESALARAEHLVESIEGRALSPRILELRGRLAARPRRAGSDRCCRGPRALPRHRRHRTRRTARAGARRMNCAKCGCENPERAKFCLECGAAFAARCASCGTELPPPRSSVSSAVRR